MVVVKQQLSNLFPSFYLWPVTQLHFVHVYLQVIVNRVDCANQYSSPASYKATPTKAHPSQHARFQMHWVSKMLLTCTPQKSHLYNKDTLLLQKGWPYTYIRGGILYKKNTTSKFQHFFKFSPTFVYRDCRKGVRRKLNKGGENPIQVLHVYQTEL